MRRGSQTRFCYTTLMSLVLPSISMCSSGGTRDGLSRGDEDTIIGPRGIPTSQRYNKRHPKLSVDSVVLKVFSVGVEGSTHVYLDEVLELVSTQLDESAGKV